MHFSEMLYDVEKGKMSNIQIRGSSPKKTPNPDTTQACQNREQGVDTTVGAVLRLDKTQKLAEYVVSSKLMNIRKYPGCLETQSKVFSDLPYINNHHRFEENQALLLKMGMPHRQNLLLLE